MDSVALAAVNRTAAVPRTPPIPLALWLAWIVLAAMTVLNFNAVAVQAGAPERVFSPALLATALLNLAYLRGQVGVITRKPVSTALLFFVLFVMIGLVSATFTLAVPLEEAFGRARQYLASVLLVLVGALMAVRVRRSGELDRLLKVLFFLAAGASLSGLVFIMVPSIANALSVTPPDRLNGVFANPNELGLQSGYVLVFGLGLSVRTRNPLWMVCGAAIGVAGVLSSFSKAAMLGLIPLPALLAYSWGGARIRVKPLLAITAATVASVVGGRALAIRIAEGNTSLNVATDQIERLAEISRILGSGTLDYETTTGRTMIWRAGLEQWARSPILGRGLASFANLPVVNLESHNTFLLVLGETGIVGICALAVLVAVVLRAVARSPWTDIRVLGWGFILVQLPLMMSTGGVMLQRNHNLVTGCVLGLLAYDAGRRPLPGRTGADPRPGWRRSEAE